ncbi:hypothetical protein [Aquamicrobium zhengzhouense]|uniref:Uncharacterized protein n=1 Tax=Aquamicrobium zhengzhouense TaxID=2781738 RepID=A0ABS0SB73_9HYPH|nr:hypothetical protein [Aquamicrobium zhengzhouense]MBI1620034.1 hypothetical protein [Aquamicrobium zhengzhouense]
MIVKEYGAEKIVCDSCDVTEVPLDGADFNATIAEMKAEGWRITRPEGQWHHECLQCVKDTSALTRTRQLFGLG